MPNLANTNRPPLVIQPAPRRSRSFTLRFTEAEFEQVQAGATAARVAISTYARAVLLDAVIPRTARRATADEKQLARMLAQLGKIGSNLNQIAQQANTTGQLAPVASLRQIGQEMAEIRLLLRAALG
jgi:hypothetical protein